MGRSVLYALALALLFAPEGATASVAHLWLASAEDGASRPPVLHVFGGRRQALPLAMVVEPTDREIVLVARLDQLADALVAPLREDRVAVIPRGSQLRYIAPEYPLVTPAVLRETSFLLSFAVASGSVGPADIVLRVELRVYPPAMLDEVRAWAGDHSIELDCADSSLRRAFDSLSIPVRSPAGSGRAADLRVTCAEDAPLSALPGAGVEPLLVVLPRPPTGEIVIEHDRLSRKVVVRGLEPRSLADAPDAQAVLLRTFRLVLDNPESIGEVTL